MSPTPGPTGTDLEALLLAVEGLSQVNLAMTRIIAAQLDAFQAQFDAFRAQFALCQAQFATCRKQLGDAMILLGQRVRAVQEQVDPLRPAGPPPPGA
jgi:hypothetical protein